MSVERALVLSMNSMDVAVNIINRLDNSRITKAMYNPVVNQGIVEDVLTRAISTNNDKLRPIP